MGTGIVAQTAPRVKTGVREQKKLDKRERIRAAARELFAEVGYDEAVLRQIAKRADIGLGTLFDYVSNKRDLVFLICNEEFDAAVKEGLVAALYKDTLFEQVVALFGEIYKYFARDVGLTRLLLRELLFFTEGAHAVYYLEIRAQTLRGLERLVRTAQQTGDIGCIEDPEVISRHIFFVASGAVRWWIAAEQPDPAAGVREFARLMALQFQGLAPRTAPVLPAAVDPAL
jgi:AcrR family transcriptional regulator